MGGRDRFRSGLERRIAEYLQRKGVAFDYESFKVPYTQPAKSRRYTPDFILPNGILVEAKGRWTTGDRQKFLMIRESWPNLDIRFVFSRSSTKISKRSKTTYADYCESKGFRYADKVIPLSWVKEPNNQESIGAINKIVRHRINN